MAREKRSRDRGDDPGAARPGTGPLDMGALVGGLAHKIRNPLFAISATLDAFEDDFDDHPSYEEYARLLRTEVDRLQALVNDLVEYGRLPPCLLTGTSLNGVVQDAVSGVRSAAGSETPIEPILDPLLPELDLDRDRLTHVLETLVSSARRRSPGSGAVVVRTRLVEEGEGRRAECVVEDPGPGVPEAEASRFFEPFFSRDEGGTGLGLAIAQRVVEEHGGSIRATNRPGGGVAVTLSLPCRRAPEAANGGPRPE